MSGYESSDNRSHYTASDTDAIAPRLPILVLVLAATAIPIEWRPFASVPFGLGTGTRDLLQNIAGYVPVGVVLAGIGSIRAVALAGCMSAFAEGMQLLMAQRDPSLADFLANVAGAVVGVMAARLNWLGAGRTVRLTTWRGIAAGVLAVALVMMVWKASGAPLNNRGFTAPGVLEAHWKLNEQIGRLAYDSSGHDLNATFAGSAAWVPGKLDGAILVEGGSDYLDAGRAQAYRLVGSMTVSAWIRSSSFPFDDAAVVSTLQSVNVTLGWQLDTTIDRGPRTIGFKLSDECANFMGRYGATPLELDTWYHIAAVYDAESQTIDVYLNGVLDNGGALGAKVTRIQRSSRLPLFIGRRSDAKGFEFSGTLDDVRIYSFALTPEEINAVMQGRSVSRTKVAPSPREVTGGPYGKCAWMSEPVDGRLPGAVALVGALVAVMCLALAPGRLVLAILASGLAGWMVFSVSSTTLPRFNLWLFPLTSAVGGAAVAFSLHRFARKPEGRRS